MADVTVALARRLTGTLLADERGMILVKTIPDAEMLATRLNCAVHHSQLPASNSRAFNFNRWARGETSLIVGTTGLEHGIDYKKVRWIIYNDVPDGLIPYNQGAGRSGRDGLPSYAYIVCRENTVICAKMRTKGKKPRAADFECVEELTKYLQNREHCRRGIITLCMDGITRTCGEVGATPCDICDPSSQFAIIGQNALEDAHNFATGNPGPQCRIATTSTSAPPLRSFLDSTSSAVTYESQTFLEEVARFEVLGVGAQKISDTSSSPFDAVSG
jgi:superfamily II DNA helicase RecQ